MTGEETLELVVELLQSVPADDEAGPLCRKLAVWTQHIIDLRGTSA